MQAAALSIQHLSFAEARSQKNSNLYHNRPGQTYTNLLLESHDCQIFNYVNIQLLHQYGNSVKAGEIRVPQRVIEAPSSLLPNILISFEELGGLVYLQARRQLFLHSHYPFSPTPPLMLLALTFLTMIFSFLIPIGNGKIEWL